jgi:drug/metabolite transporter (DMT)-like permease
MAVEAAAPSKWRFGWVALAVVIVQLGFGAYGILVKKFAQNENANPVFFSFVRDIACFPVLLLAGVVAEGWQVPRSPRELFLFGILGFFGMFFGQLFYVLAVFFGNANVRGL